MQRPERVEILVLGGTGMSGPQNVQLLRERFPETTCTIRGSVNDSPLANIELFQSGNIFEHCDITDFPTFESFLSNTTGILINCVGTSSRAPLPSVSFPTCSQTRCCRINFLRPARAGWKAHPLQYRLRIQRQTRLAIEKEDTSDAEDLYGRTKFLEKCQVTNALTLRTSIIGRELSSFSILIRVVPEPESWMRQWLYACFLLRCDDNSIGQGGGRSDRKSD